MRRFFYTFLWLVLFSFVFSFSLAKGAEKETSRDHSKKMKSLEDRIEALEKKLKIKTEDGEKDGDTENGETNLTAGYKDGFFIRSKDEKYEMTMNGFLMMGLALFETDTTDNNGFYSNGIFLQTDIFYDSSWHGRVELNVASPAFTNQFQSNNNVFGFSLQDAYIEYLGSKIFNVRVGNTLVPFTIEGQYKPNDSISIWAEPFIASWAHFWDPGIMFHGLFGNVLEYKVSAHGGSGNATMNNDDSMLFAGQLRYYPFTRAKNPYTFFHLGAIAHRSDGRNTDGSVNSANLYTPWGRQVFDPRATGNNDDTRQWKAGVDVGFRYDSYLDSAKTNRLWIESEFMYLEFQRHFNSGKQSNLQGVGYALSIMYQRNFTPQIEGAGALIRGKFSYTSIDNDDDSSRPGNQPGQYLRTYTLGLGYAFNKHAFLEFEWIFINAAERNTYGTPKSDGDSDALEMAWFFRLTLQW